MLLTAIHPKLPMRFKSVTRNFYVNVLKFHPIGIEDYKGYLMLQKDNVQIHFFEHTTLNPDENYGQVYLRVDDIETLYNSYLENNVPVHPNGHLEIKPWRQKEFSVLDPDNNLLTFGQSIV